LIIKFGKFEKIESSSFLFGTVWFRQFHGKVKEETKLEDLKIRGVLRHRKILKSIKKSRWKKSKPESDVIKIELSGFRYQSICFS
jgi:hypothetical protein